MYELDLSDPSKVGASDLGTWSALVRDVGPAFVRRIDECDRGVAADADAATSKPLSLQTDSPPAIKLQVNSGGGSFPWHYDNPGPPNNRVLTCIVYLNPRWKDGDGGEIVLWPFLSQKVVVPPLHRRAVFFYSDRVLHRVLPSMARRVCFTVWCNGTDVNAKEDVALSREHLQFTSYDAARDFFARSPLQRVISRAVYSEEYLESLLECIVSKGGAAAGGGDDGDGVSPEKEEALRRQHEASVVGILSKLRPLIEEFRRRKDALATSSNENDNRPR